jgi:Ni/Co efflux regulator RcnB/surface antigen
MKRVTALIIALSLMSGTAAIAQPGGQGEPGQRPNCGQPGQPACPAGQRPDGDRGDRGDRDDGQPGQPTPRVPGGPDADRPAAAPPPGATSERPGFNRDGRRWSKGQRVPAQYRDKRYVVTDWRRNNLRQPPRGYQWICQPDGNCFLVSQRNGEIRETRFRDDRENNWRRRYSRSYSYNDDVYYRECRDRPDPAGVIAGGIIGGLLGRAIGNNDGGSTVAGVIIGGALGATLTRDLDCDDRSYAYKSYYSALNSGRAGTVYRWRNPRNGRRGEFRVRSYYYDQDGFACANYQNVTFYPNRRQVRGRACRQPNGAWVFIS